jgi:AraC-like DNA-binding protein
MVWEPGRPHYYGNRAAPWEHSWVHLRGSCVRRALDRSGVARNEPIQLAGAYVVDRYLQALFAEVSGYPNPDGVILERLIECWMRELARALRPPGGPVVPARLLEVKQYLETHVAQPQRLPDLAARACLSVPHFCSRFKRHFGVSAIEHLLRLRMQHAAFLLRDMTMSAKEVARAAGYQDIYYFSKLFKKHHGVGPRAFRQRMARDSEHHGDKDAGRPQTTGPRRRATKRNAEIA